jgi:hypothetical protein
MDPITEAETALIHVHARSLAAAQVVALGAFNADDMAEDAIRLFVATKAAIESHNGQVEIVAARVAERLGSGQVTPPAGVMVVGP